MAVLSIKISTKKLPNGYSVIPTQILDKSSKRINAAMKIAAKKYQEKKIVSLEKASKTFVSK